MTIVYTLWRAYSVHCELQLSLGVSCQATFSVTAQPLSLRCAQSFCMLANLRSHSGYTGVVFVNKLAARYGVWGPSFISGPWIFNEEFFLPQHVTNGVPFWKRKFKPSICVRIFRRKFFHQLPSPFHYWLSAASRVKDTIIIIDLEGRMEESRPWWLKGDLLIVVRGT